MVRRAPLLSLGSATVGSSNCTSSSSRSSSLSPASLSPRRNAATAPLPTNTTTPATVIQVQHRQPHQDQYQYRHAHHYAHPVNTPTLHDRLGGALSISQCVPQTSGTRILAVCVVSCFVVAVNLFVVFALTERASFVRLNLPVPHSFSRSFHSTHSFSTPLLYHSSALLRASGDDKNLDTKMDAEVEEEAVTDGESERGLEEEVPVFAKDGYARIAYFIQVSEPTIDLLPRLLRTLHNARDVYAVHFDGKISNTTRLAAVERIRAESAYNDNVFVMHSEIITYRGVSMLLNTISAIRYLRALSIHGDPAKRVTWDYFINLSAADYPLLTPHTIGKLLGREEGLNFFSFANRSNWAKMAENRLSQIWFDDALSLHNHDQDDRSHITSTHSLHTNTLPPQSVQNELTRLPVRNPLVDRRGFEVSYAEAWMILSKAFCDFILDSDLAQKLLISFGFAADSSEHYFATVAWNAPEFHRSIVPHSFRVIIWKHEGVKSGQHPFYIDEQRNTSYIFKPILQNTRLFFTRKFHVPNSPLMDWVDIRAAQPDVVEKATQHFLHKVQTRHAVLAQL